jgi:capsid assembly protease
MTPILFRLLSDVPMIHPDAVAAWLVPAKEREIAAESFGRALAARIPIIEQAAEHPGSKRMRDMMAVVETVSEDGIATVPISGPLAFAPDPWEMAFDGVEDIRSVSACIGRVKADPKVKGVLLNISSPGGMMMGGLDLADEVGMIGKPVVAYTGGMMASLAYLIASQADEIVASSSAAVGSLGAILSVMDVTKLLADRGIKVEVFRNKEAKYKGIGTPGTSMNDAQREHLQARADAGFAAFRDMVLAKRKDVPDSAMQGQMFWGKEAKAAGLVDRVGSIDLATSVLRQRIRNRAAR